MVLATVPAAPPALKNQRETSCPPPISAMVPYVLASRFRASAFCRAPRVGVSILDLLENPRHHQGLIVPWRLTMLVSPNGVTEVADELRRPVIGLAECARQPGLIELIAIGIPRLGDSIGVEQNIVARLELHGGFFK